MSRGTSRRFPLVHTAKHADETTLALPDYFQARGMLRDKGWVEAYISLVLQWPKACTLSKQDRQLIGLAKSLASSWEPGILNHTDLALRVGSSPEVVSEVLKAAAVTIGFARLDSALRGQTAGRSGSATPETLKQVKEFFGVTPRFFSRNAVMEDRRWFKEFLDVTLPAYDSRPDVIHPRLRALVCLAAASVLGWEGGIALYSRASRRFGATGGELSDVVKSVFKTAVSNAMAAGFRTPCHIPRLEEYRTILSAYVEEGALARRKRDPLTRSPSSR